MTLETTWNSYSLNQTVELQELAIALFAKTLDPKLAQPDFFQFSGIIPQDWQLQSNPVLNDNLAQFNFENGVNILAQPRTISFFEALGREKSKPLEVPSVARRYINKLPHVDYQALSINPKTIVSFPNQKDGARKYGAEALLSPKLARVLDRAPARASIGVVYELQRCQLQLSINEVNVQKPDGSLVPALLFSGNFNYSIAGETANDKYTRLEQCLDNWQTDLDTFRELVQTHFLGESDSIFPPEMM
ncbi:hypothetical protein [Lusitaniella coriacea]|uniref:hypothetical protein n=1 Tax=Lusitaniella coriacea TaxID=1983105 RepID=UPI003CED5475